MKGKLLWSIFWALVGVFVIAVSTMFVPPLGMLLGRFNAFVAWPVIAGLGVTLIVLTVRVKVRGMLKKFFLLSGASAVGLPVSVLLHGAVYALFILWFGEGFWGAGGDEPFFFILATIVCPVAFLVGAIGSIVLGVKKSPSRRW